MTSLVLYIDGSSVRVSATSKKQSTLGWGLVAYCEEQQIERSGAYSVPTEHCALHETVALIEAVRFAHNAGYAPAQVSLYTDDEYIGYAGTYLHEGNYLGVQAQKLLQRVKQACKALYSPAVYELTVRYLHEARIQKVKSHSFLVSNHRCDYLAKRAAKLEAKHEVASPFETFSAWLKKGFVYYTRESQGEPLTWYPPFADNLEEARPALV